MGCIPYNAFDHTHRRWCPKGLQGSSDLNNIFTVSIDRAFGYSNRTAAAAANTAALRLPLWCWCRLHSQPYSVFSASTPEFWIYHQKPQPRPPVPIESIARIGGSKILTTTVPCHAPLPARTVQLNPTERLCRTYIRCVNATAGDYQEERHTATTRPRTIATTQSSTICSKTIGGMGRGRDYIIQSLSLLDIPCSFFVFFLFCFHFFCFEI